MADKEPKRRRSHRSHPLSAKHIRFCQKVVAGELSHYDAFVSEFGERASPNATHQAASHLLSKAKFKEYIGKLLDIASLAAETTTEEIFANIARIAKADRRKLFKDGQPLSLDKLPDDIEPIVEGYDIDREGRVRVRTGNRLAAWSKLAELKAMTGAARKPDAEGSDPVILVRGAAKVEPPKTEPQPES